MKKLILYVIFFIVSIIPSLAHALEEREIRSIIKDEISRGIRDLERDMPEAITEREIREIVRDEIDRSLKEWERGLGRMNTEREIRNIIQA